jgi:hypothetical protein
MSIFEVKIIFVVGSVRSGTSIVGQALTQVLGGGHGFFEGNVTGLLTSVADAVDGYYRNFTPEFLQPSGGFQISQLPKEWMKASLQQFVIAEFARPILASGSAVWVDKSPDGNPLAEKVRACSVLAKAFPQAKFVFCRRNGVENLASRMRKWPEATFINQCYGWAGVMEAWAKVRPELAGRYCEVDQYTLVEDPKRVADDLANVLGATEQERDGLLAFFTGGNLEQTSESREQPPRTVAEIDWDLMRKWIFLAICGPSMGRYRYRIGSIPAADRDAPILTLDHPTIPVEQVNTSNEAGIIRKLAGGFQLQPLDPSRPGPTVIFRNVPAWPRMRLRGALVHGAQRTGVSVFLRIRVNEAQSGREIFNQRIVLAPGEALELDEPMECAEKFVDVAVSSAISPWRRAASFAWARIVGLSCTPAAPPAEHYATVEVTPIP